LDEACAAIENLKSIPMGLEGLVRSIAESFVRARELLKCHERGCEPDRGGGQLLLVQGVHSHCENPNWEGPNSVLSMLLAIPSLVRWSIEYSHGRSMNEVWEGKDLSNAEDSILGAVEDCIRYTLLTPFLKGSTPSYNNRHLYLL
jgi:hypothetical protein